MKIEMVNLWGEDWEAIYLDGKIIPGGEGHMVDRHWIILALQEKLEELGVELVYSSREHQLENGDTYPFYLEEVSNGDCQVSERALS